MNEKKIDINSYAQNFPNSEKYYIEGYAWPYDGGTKQKDFEELRILRRSRGTLTE